ncbi:hypothetical protein [Priestia flexa]|uniref:hypothetical protein n=1 Tax=Priestia flexa TaxID=86664 RepID=UPI000473C4EC|nr:hypothetical protein [Priestia flexa]
MISGAVTVIYRLPKTSITNVDHKVYGEMLVFGDSNIVVDADGDIVFNSIQNKYEYKRANRETKYPKKPNVKSAIASYRQLYDIALDGLSLRDQSHFDSVDNMKLLIGQLKDELELLKLQNQEMLKMIYKNSNN